MAIKDALKFLQSGQSNVSYLPDGPPLDNILPDSSFTLPGPIGDSLVAARNSVAEKLSTFADPIKEQISGGIGNIVSNIVPAISTTGRPSSSRGSGSLTYPETLNNISLNPACINFQFYTRNTGGNTSEAKVRSTSINLPMPDNVNNPSTINWDQQDFGMIGDTLVKGLKAMGDDATITSASVQEKINAMTERVKSLAFYTGMANVVGGLGGANIDANALMGAVSGRIANPYKTMLFRGVDFRTFSFQFKFVPFSESDCDLIDTIISKFRAHSYPDFLSDKMFFSYPDECQITYMWETGHNKWLNNFKRAVCTGIDVEFAPLGQWSSLRNGFPNMIVLTTKWSEVEIITKDDIKFRDTTGQRS